jgi:hypothetical protein
LGIPILDPVRENSCATEMFGRVDKNFDIAVLASSCADEIFDCVEGVSVSIPTLFVTLSIQGLSQSVFLMT